ncbi:chromate resistance protein ChrB domain-containing protein [Vibrio astriarenae]
MRTLKLKTFLQLLLLCSISTQSLAKVQEVFGTWGFLEADKLATIWLIKRYISPDNEIIWVEEYTKPDNVTLFDTPMGGLTRSAKMATYETVLLHYNITDDAATSMVPYIHDIEINTWGNKRYEESYIIESELTKLLGSQLSKSEVVTSSLVFFDTLTKRTQTRDATYIPEGTK